MVIKPVRRTVAKWSRDLYKMWGVRVQPQVTHRYSVVKRRSSLGTYPFPVVEKRVSQKIPPMTVTTAFGIPVLGQARPTSGHKKKGVIYLHPRPDLLSKNRRLKKSDVHANVAHEIGHVVGYSIKEKVSHDLSNFLAVLSEVEYARRFDKPRFEGFMHVRYRSSHFEFDEFIRRIMLSLPDSKTRNILVRRMIQNKVDSSAQLLDFWQEAGVDFSRNK